MSFDLSIVAYGAPIFAEGMLNTVFFCVISIAIAVVCGFGIALGRLSNRRAIGLPAAALVQIVRNTPFLVQVYLLYYALPAIGVRLGATWAGIIALSTYASGYFAEAIRGAILSVPRGQMDTAQALGLTRFGAMRLVVVPQMMRYLLPALTNQMIGIVKDSAVLSVITTPELTMAAQQVLGETFAPVESYAMVALLYWLFTGLLAAGMGRLERRFLVPGTRQSWANE
ncbi:MAG: amino acid ABC transporter permease [Acetobacteraceae bacterium]|nr:amino acid ABC transporter permease [Acetobacteraceae bacterium]